MKVVLIGAGNVATQLGQALVENGHQLVQLYSRTESSAAQLAARLECDYTTSLDELTTEADIYLFCVKDDVLASLIPKVVEGRESALFLHTAGSIPCSIFQGIAFRYGVFYPMQTFSKSRNVDFSVIPCFIEADSPETAEEITHFAKTLSRRVVPLSSEKRKQLHLSAVFACNFVNHCYAIAADIVDEIDLPFDLLTPLIDETAAKVHQMEPAMAQTGPAVRYDEVVLNRQRNLLEQHPQWQRIYDEMSTSIHQAAKAQIKKE